MIYGEWTGCEKRKEEKGQVWKEKRDKREWQIEVGPSRNGIRDFILCDSHVRIYYTNWVQRPANHKELSPSQSHLSL